MTRNKNEQMKAGVVRYAMVMVASLAVSSATMALVRAFGGGLSGWRFTALIYAAIFLVMSLIVHRYVKEYDDFEADYHADKPVDDTKNLVEGLLLLMKNPYFVEYVLVCTLYNAILTMNNSVGVYYMKYILGNEDLLGLFSLSTMGIIVGIMFAPLLEKKLGIYKMTLFGWIVSCALDIGFIAGAYMNSLAMMLIFNALRYVAIGPYAASNIAICSEIAKYSYLKHDAHLEASCNGSMSMGTKIGAGIGTAAMGWLLAASGYVANSAVQPASANHMLIFMYAVLPCIIHVVVTVLLGLMKVEKANAALLAEKGGK